MNVVTAVDSQVQINHFNDETESFGELCALVKRHSKSKSLCDGRTVHASIVASGYDADTFMANSLVQMYGDCESLLDAKTTFSRTPSPNQYSWNILLGVLSRSGGFEDAKAIFSQMPCKDVVSWNSMIGASIQQGSPTEALNLLFCMRKDGIQPSQVSFLTALGACSSLASLDYGLHVHASIIGSGFDGNYRLGNALIHMLGKCEDLDGAEVVFSKMHDRNSISWSSMIAAYVHNGQSRDALALFYRMETEGIKPDEVTFLSVLTACANLGDIAEGQQIHNALLAGKFEKDRNVGNALINTYAKCGDFCKAKQAFDQIVDHDVVSWTALMGASLVSGFDQAALEIFSEMQCQGIKANYVTFVYALDACANLRALERGREIHDAVCASVHKKNVFVGNALVNMYGKCGLLEEAKGLFTNMNQKNVASWNTLMTVYAQNGFLDEALELFAQIPEKDVISWNALITALAQNGRANKAVEVFANMAFEGINPNTSTFVSVVDACGSLQDFECCLQIHTTIICTGNESDSILRNALLNMYGKCGCLDVARYIFDTMKDRNLISWSALIAAYVQNGQENQALGLFWDMSRCGVIPDEVTFTCVLAACADSAILDEGQRIHASIVAYGLESRLAVENSLLSLYSGCGSIGNLKVSFSKMYHRDVVSWTRVMAGTAQCGESKEALKLFSQMQIEGVKPDEVTYVGVMTACSHSGEVSDDRGYFSLLGLRDYGLVLKAEHYVCMVDLLGRAGHLAEAEKLIDIMPKEKFYLGWLSLLSSCRNHGDLKRGIGAGLRCFQLEPTRDAPFPLLRSLLNVARRDNAQFEMSRLQKLCAEEQVEDLIQELAAVYDRA
ncbi:hypothetical protein GOP47_0018184 [Adiantum capillus-veneris]|uniref:Pentatricopeptide repeat-containing protein n=1 Tax=Adiantum capillus-veneris TaxID=13818 RepID=A0A9D4UGU7_ADICA|nr:hypothetical protein GOP47_0018184 [Adiantum capillus-veneris]